MNALRSIVAASFGACALGIAADAQALAVTGTSPALNASNIPRGTAISITFDTPVAPATVNASSLRVWGRSSGTATGTVTYSLDSRTLTFTSATPYFPGELVTINLARTIGGTDTSTLRSGGYAFSFLTVVNGGSMNFTEIDSVTVRTQAQTTTRLYGGAFADLDENGWIDFVGINEISADLRVLMNRSDGTGLVHPVKLPPTPIGQEASPSEAVDFDNDGFVDVATSNTSSNSVSIVLGNGDGSFAPQQQVPVGNVPHGLAALDADGDADLDLVTANQGSGNLSLLLNDGNGVFGASTPFDFDTGNNGQYPLAAGDMDHDGLIDLVVGTRNDNQVHVLHANGNGTFTRVSNRSAGGLTWMMAVGDVDNDGRLDVSSVNGQTNNGAILRGNGDGTLQAAALSSFGGSMVATDLGDLDGDGDLDWVTSSFGAARWYVLRNDAGVFTQVQTITADANASCASLYDFDNDGDLDMALADETADVVLLLRNEGSILFRNGYEGPP